MKNHFVCFVAVLYLSRVEPTVSPSNSGFLVSLANHRGYFDIQMYSNVLVFKVHLSIAREEIERTSLMTSLHDRCSLRYYPFRCGPIVCRFNVGM